MRQAPGGGEGAEPQPKELLRSGLERLGVPDPAAAQALLDRYLDELERWNGRFGLVGPVDRRDLVVRHVLDSLAPWRLVEELAAGGAGSARAVGGSILDVGSGAGFPGLPLAILRPDLPITLLERSKRRSLFLRTCTVLLGLPCVTVLQQQLSEALGSFEVVTFRAVAPLQRFVGELERSRIEARAIIAYKGRLQRAREEVEAVRRARGGDVVQRASGAPVLDDRGALTAEVLPLHVPFLDEERCVVVFRHGQTLTNR